MSYLYDITQGVIYKKVLQQLKCYYPFTNFIIKPISRIFTNNIVYKAYSAKGRNPAVDPDHVQDSDLCLFTKFLFLSKD